MSYLAQGMLRIFMPPLHTKQKTGLELIYMRACMTKNNPLQTEVKVFDVFLPLSISADVWFFEVCIPAASGLVFDEI